MSVEGATCFVTFAPAKVEKLIVINGPCDDVYALPDYLDMMLAQVPRKPYADDEVLDDKLVVFTIEARFSVNSLMALFAAA